MADPDPSSSTAPATPAASREGLPRIVLVLLVGAALVIVMAGVRAAPGLVGPSFLALVLTITVHPMRRWLARHRVPEWIGSVAAILAVYLILVLVLVMLVVSVGRLAALLPQYTDEIKSDLSGLGDWLQARGVGNEQVQAVVDSFNVSSLVGVATSVLSSILDVLSNLFFIATLLLFIAFDTTRTTRALAAIEKQRPDLVAALVSFAHGTRSYMGVSAGFGLIVAVIDTIALALMGVPGAFVWGVLAFVTNFIPNIGFVLGVVPPALIALLDGGVGLMVVVIVVYAVINFVIQSVIQPRIVGGAVGLSATVTFLSLVFWGFEIGALGALLAVPLSLLLKALLVEADPAARWALPLISGQSDDSGPEPVSARSVTDDPLTDDPDPDAPDAS